MKTINSTIAPKNESNRKRVIKLARKDPRVHAGDLEIDDNAVVSWSTDNGAYVQVWLWVDFSDTEMNEDP